MSALRDIEQWLSWFLFDWYPNDGFLLGLLFLFTVLAMMIKEMRDRDYTQAGLSFVLFIAIGMTLPMP